MFNDYLPASMKPDKAAVIYADDPRGAQLIAACRAQGLAVWSYGDERLIGMSVRRKLPLTSGGIRGEIQAKERRSEELLRRWSALSTCKISWALSGSAAPWD